MMVNGWSFDLDLLRARTRGTAACLEQAIMDNVPHVSAVRVSDAPEPFTAVCRITVRWYAWLTLGALHLVTRVRARRVMGLERPAGIVIKVVVR